jgi:hypothetical protein
MKHFLTILIFFLTSTGLFATGYGNPNLHLTDDTVKFSGNPSHELDNINILSYTGSDSIELKWEVIKFDNTLPTSWEFGFCDNEGCYTLNETSTNTIWLPASKPASMHLTVSPNNIIGSGTVRIAIYPSGGTVNDGVIITYIFSIGVSIKNATAVNFTMYPNPVKDYLNINFTKKGLQHIEVYNILGNKVIDKDVANTDFVRIPFTNFQRGRYIVMYRSENGKIITKSITKE